MSSNSTVLSDMSRLRAELREANASCAHLLVLNPLRPLLDIALDWVVVLWAVSAVVWLSWWAAIPAVFVVGNRQRALGNMLHEAGHRNICRDRRINDVFTRACIAPLVFASLSTYRSLHFKHHMELGQQDRDPDFLLPPTRKPDHWLTSYARIAFHWGNWTASLFGHLVDRNTNATSRLFILAWWLALCVVLYQSAGMRFVATFFLIWFAARATVFHLITMLREMCDHFGLCPGGVLGFTRDMTGFSMARRFIHPRNNGYHLTHHLLPAVPYYRLPEAQRMLSKMTSYPDEQVRQSYVFGPGAVTLDWQEKGLV